MSGVGVSVAQVACGLSTRCGGWIGAGCRNAISSDRTRFQIKQYVMGGILVATGAYRAVRTAITMVRIATARPSPGGSHPPHQNPIFKSDVNVLRAPPRPNGTQLSPMHHHCSPRSLVGRVVAGETQVRGGFPRAHGPRPRPLSDIGKSKRSHAATRPGNRRPAHRDASTEAGTATERPGSGSSVR